MSSSVAEISPAPAVKTAVVTPEDKFLFDLQGFILLRGVLSAEECREYLALVEELEAQPHDDRARRDKLNRTGRPSQATLELSANFKRLNGLLRLNSAFDALIAHPGVAPYLDCFMGGEAQLVNTWSISKDTGHDSGAGWHRGVAPTEYTCRNGNIRSSMLNTVWFLTENGPDDGCMVALPGGHKSNFDLNFGAYHGLAMPGSRAITGQPGDVFLFSEAVLHTGLTKTTPGRRTNLYYNYTTRDFNVMTYTPEHNFHFCMPESIRARFTPKQRDYTYWMEFMQAAE